MKIKKTWDLKEPLEDLFLFDGIRTKFCRYGDDLVISKNFFNNMDIAILIDYLDKYPVAFNISATDNRSVEIHIFLTDDEK